MSDYNIEEDIKVPRFSEENGFYTTKARSKTMSKIRSKNTKPEILLRKSLWQEGIRYRKDYKKLPGRPDIFISKAKLVVFVDGAFWHGHDWESKRDKIKSNRDFWLPKIERNMQRDRANNAKLIEMGLKVIRFWDFEVNKNLETCMAQILEYLNNKD
jgi:DNA mismatch endonuclease (patch repair protein)